MHRAPTRGRTTGWRAPASTPACTTSISPTRAPSSRASARSTRRRARRRAGGERRQHGAGGLRRRCSTRWRRDSPRRSRVSIVIAPGNSFDPGLATTQSILGTLGSPFAVPRDGRMATTLHGWQGVRRRHCPGLGERWVGDCDVPDLDLLPRALSGPDDGARSMPASRSAPFIWACGGCPGWCAPACCAGPSGWRGRCWPSSARCGSWARTSAA